MILPSRALLASLLCIWCYCLSSTSTLALALSGDPTKMTGTQDSKPPAMIEYQSLNKDLPAETAQEIVWQMLMHAAHESDLEQVKANPLLQPYAQNYGQQEGDIGVVAMMRKESKPESDDEAVMIPIGAAWVRFLPGVGFATAHLVKKEADDNTEDSITEEFKALQAYPELAIACLPEYRGMGVGSSLLQSLFRAVQGDGKYPGICLSCRADNAALRLYERSGFVNVAGSELTNRAGGVSLSMKYTFQKEGSTER